MRHSLSVINLEIEKINKRQAKIQELLEFSPAIEFIELQQEFGRKLNSGVDRFSPEFIEWVKVSAKREKYLKQKMKTQQKDQQKLWDEQLENNRKLNDLSNTSSMLSMRLSA